MFSSPLSESGKSVTSEERRATIKKSNIADGSKKAAKEYGLLQSELEQQIKELTAELEWERAQKEVCEIVSTLRYSKSTE